MNYCTFAVVHAIKVLSDIISCDRDLSIAGWQREELTSSQSTTCRTVSACENMCDMCVCVCARDDLMRAVDERYIMAEYHHHRAFDRQSR